MGEVGRAYSQHPIFSLASVERQPASRAVEPSSSSPRSTAARNMDSKQPPPYSAMPQPQPLPGYTPAQTYQPYPSGPTQPPLYPPMPQPPQQSTVIIQTTTTSNLVPIGSGPTRIRCPSCHAEVVTTVKSTPSGRTHCWALVLCLFVCWPCVCLPYCMDSCQNANHYCPNCSSYIGTYEN